MLTMEDYRESAAYLMERLAGFQPEVLLILGSGLGALAEQAQNPIFIPYENIPHFVKSTVMGHTGRFVAGDLGGKAVLMMQGRFHLYEGYTPEQVAYPVRVAGLTGIKSMVVTNAAGGVNPDFKPGELMLITDFIRFAAPDPLIGPNLDEFGPRFPDMSYVFDRDYIKAFRLAAAEAGDRVQTGVYFSMTGPRYETPAEIKAIRILGGDAVGMSTVPEVVAGNHMGMRILGISLIANMAAGMLDQPLSGEEVIAAAEAAGERFCAHMVRFLERI